MAVSESNMTEFKMAAIITVESEWRNEVFFVQIELAKSMMSEFKIAAIIRVVLEWMSLSQIEN